MTKLRTSGYYAKFDAAHLFDGLFVPTNGKKSVPKRSWIANLGRSKLKPMPSLSHAMVTSPGQVIKRHSSTC